MTVSEVRRGDPGMYPGHLLQVDPVPGDGGRGFCQLKKLAEGDRMWRGSGRGSDTCACPGAWPWVPVWAADPFPRLLWGRD